MVRIYTLIALRASRTLGWALLLNSFLFHIELSLPAEASLQHHQQGLLLGLWQGIDPSPYAIRVVPL